MKCKWKPLTSTAATEATRTSLGLRRSTASRLCPGWNSVSSRLDPGHLISNNTIYRLYTSVWDPEPDPDPHVFGLPDPDPLVRGMDPEPAQYPSLFS